MVAVAGAATETLPMWAAYFIGGLGLLCGILITFVLGLIANRLSGGDGDKSSGRQVAGGGGHDCANCTQIARVLDGQNALNQRIDNWMLTGKGGG